MTTLKRGATTYRKPQVKYEWKEISKTCWQWGDIRLMLIDDPDHAGEKRWWYHVKVKIRDKTQWRRAHIASRPWGYSRPANAWVGFGQIRTFYYS